MNDALAAQRAGLDPLVLDAIAGVRADADAPEVAPSLPGDHPAWQRDVVSISARARAFMATLRPIVIKVVTFWEHRFASIAIGSQRLAVDVSGCYRLV
jgi:hypothetical protein